MTQNPMVIACQQWEIDEIVRLSGMDKVIWGTGQVSQFKVVDYRGRRVKVRAYKSSSVVARQLELVQYVKEMFPQIRGHYKNCLVLDYLAGSYNTEEPAFLEQLGAYLGKLSNITKPYSPKDDFKMLLEPIEQARLFRSSTLGLLYDYYFRNLNSGLDWTLEYFDARPANFVQNSTGIISIDEKHLRIGPRGISLVKPKKFLPPSHYEIVEESYYKITGFLPFKDPSYSNFLNYYWNLYTLVQRVQSISSTGDLFIKPVYRFRKNVLVSANSPTWVRMVEEVPWRLRIASKWWIVRINYARKHLLPMSKQNARKPNNHCR